MDPARAAEKAPWAAYIYIAANNDLEPYAFGSLAQIVSAEPRKTPIIVAMHLKSRKGTYLLNLSQVSKKGLDDERLLREATVAVWPDRDFSDVQVLNEFLQWAGKTYPAERTAFIYWGHGMSWRGFAQDDSSRDPERYIRFSQFRESLERLQLEGIHFEWIAFDACSIGIAEVAYELRNVTPYVVFSTLEVPYYSYPYDTIFAPWARATNSGQQLPDARTMVRQLVERFGEYYSGDARAIPKGNPLEAFNLAAIDTARLSAQRPFFKRLAEEFLREEIGATHWFRELQARISSYDSVADVDAMLYYLGHDMRPFRAEIAAARTELGYTSKPESISRQVKLAADDEAIANVRITVTSGRYNEVEARRALSEINSNSPLRWVNEPIVDTGKTSDAIVFEIELNTRDRRGRYALAFNPFVLGSQHVDIVMREADARKGADVLERISLDRASDRETRVDFPATSALVAETHGAEMPEFRSFGVLFTDQLPEENFPKGLESYRELQWERDTSWGAAMLELSRQSRYVQSKAWGRSSFSW